MKAKLNLVRALLSEDVVTCSHWIYLFNLAEIVPSGGRIEPRALGTRITEYPTGVPD